MMNIRPAVAGVAGLVAGVVLAGGVAVAHPTVIGDVRIGIHGILDEAANRSTPTGRQVDDDLSLIIRQQIDEAFDCYVEFGDTRCIGEGAPVP